MEYHDIFGYSQTIDMHERIKTFKNWPITFLSGEQMARNGFYYLGRGDIVRCAFCKVEIYNWEQGDNPAEEHKRWAPQCHYLRELAYSKSDNKNDPIRYSHTVDMRHEYDRMKTFKNWPVSFVTGEQLARNGFYYLGDSTDSDKVCCAFCNLKIFNWEQGDDPAENHKQWAPLCPFVRKLECLKSVGRDECKSHMQQDSPPRMPDHDQSRYAYDAAHLPVFEDRLRCMYRKPKELGNELADFFRIRQSDKAKCFFCDNELKDMKNDDLQHWEHLARWSLDYVLKMMTDECSISAPDAEKNVMPDLTAVKQCTVMQPPKSSLDDSRICKICYERERNVCFLPCRHFVACSKCALTYDKCPVCRRVYESLLLLYYS